MGSSVSICLSITEGYVIVHAGAIASSATPSVSKGQKVQTESSSSSCASWSVPARWGQIVYSAASMETTSPHHRPLTS